MTSPRHIASRSPSQDSNPGGELSFCHPGLHFSISILESPRRRGSVSIETSYRGSCRHSQMLVRMGIAVNTGNDQQPHLPPSH